ncbi:LysR family transcriptional regulator [Streptomyces sp. SL13]|uniref:LysR family transcriptional regulator n=1 Tax=Streptantibioticus silvisoli TaxID=2705255 RepID=A0AA90KI93_9ACTN|nr:LysR family transcriptional regulator [Streptantibioticus silvisoli]MDI5972735.1 LysR family transcriptional regulator [Streptantibioticus silvisoli]
MIEARHLRVLRAVSRTGSFSAAARELGITQPAVSQQMKALEHVAGTPLVVRVGRSTRLTEAGRALTRHAAGILAGLTAAEEEVAAIAGLRSGKVRMVSFPSGSSTIAPVAIARMRAENPGTQVFLEDAEPPRSVELLRSGDCEVALAFRYVGRHGHVDLAEWDDLVVTSLLTDRLVGLLPAAHPLAPPAATGQDAPAAHDGPGGLSGSGSPGDGRAPGLRREGVVARESRTPWPVPLASLADEAWIAGCPRCRRHLIQVCDEEGFSPRIDFATDDSPAVAGLVGAGLGVALLPELAVRSLRLRNVALVDVHPFVRREVVALTLPDLAKVPAVEQLMARLAEAAQG